MTKRQRSYSTVLVTPIMVLTALQLPSCARNTDENEPPPGGAYVSTSAGASFEQAVNLVDDAGNQIGYIAGFALQKMYRVPHNVSRIYATIGQSSVFYSDDVGKTWRELSAPLSVTANIIELENGALLAAGTASNGSGAVVRSLDHGKSWETVLSIPAPTEPKKKRIEIIKPPGSGQPPTVITALTYDPFVSDRVYAATSRGDILIGEQSGKLWRSVLTIQSGTTNPFTGLQNSGISELIPSSHEANEILIITSTRQMLRLRGDKIEALTVVAKDGSRRSVFDVTYIQQFPDALYVAVNDGAMVSRDRGVTWTQLNLPISAPHPYNSVAVAVSPTNPARLLAAANSVVLRSEDGGQTWSTLSLELPSHAISDISIDPTNAAQVILTTIPISN